MSKKINLNNNKAWLRKMTKLNDNECTSVYPSYPCTTCGWAMGEKEGKPMCDHCKPPIKNK